MSAPFFCHWYLSGAVPAPTTLNAAVCPAVTVWLTGCAVIVGAVAAAFTVSVAALLVTVPALLLTTTSYVAQDRKSTRLNSSHSQISYAVFCLKKKKKPSVKRLRRVVILDI